MPMVFGNGRTSGYVRGSKVVTMTLGRLRGRKSKLLRLMRLERSVPSLANETAPKESESS